MADALRPREQRVGELLDVHVRVAVHMLKPGGRVARRVLNFQHLDAAPIFIGLQHGGHVGIGVLGKGVGQINCVFQREFGATANRVVRSVGGVTHQHNGRALVVQCFPVHPVVANHAGKLNPIGRAAQMLGVAHQVMAIQILGKQVLAKRHAFVLAHGVQAMRFPNRFGCFHNEGGGVVVVLVGMRLKPTVLGLLEGKGESVKGFVRAQPDKAAITHINVGLVGVGIAGADAAVQAIAGNHQVGLVVLRQRLVVGHVGFKHQLHIQLFAALLQDVEQVLAAYPTKTMATGAHALPFEKHLDVVPMVERIPNQLRGVRVGGLQVLQGLVAEHHAPAKGVVGAVAFDHGDLVRRVLLLHEQREIQASGATANAQNVHAHIVEA